MGSGDHIKAVVSEGPSVGFADVLNDHKIRHEINALETGQTISEELADKVFGQIIWPVALGRPPGNLAAAFNVECSYDLWEHYPIGGEDTWKAIATPCPVKVVEGRNDEATYRVNFVASSVPDNLDPPNTNHPVYTHVRISILNEKEWSHPGGTFGIAQAGSKRVVPSPYAFLKHPGAMLLTFDVQPGFVP